MADYDFADALYAEQQDSYERRFARASLVLSRAIEDAGLLSFVGRGNSKVASSLRMELARRTLEELVHEASEQFDVEYDDLLKVAEKTIDPDKPIGGAEGKKYKNTTSLGDAAPDATTKVNDTKPVLENPDDLDTYDLNKDKAKKSGSVSIIAADISLEDFDGEDIDIEDVERDPDISDDEIQDLKDAIKLHGSSLEDDALRVILRKIKNRG